MGNYLLALELEPTGVGKDGAGVVDVTGELIGAIDKILAGAQLGDEPPSVVKGLISVPLLFMINIFSATSSPMP